MKNKKNNKKIHKHLKQKNLHEVLKINRDNYI